MSYLGLIIGYLIIILTPIIGQWNKTLPRLDKKSTDAFIPFMGYFSVLRACSLPWYWIIFLLMPGIQFIMWACINVTYIRKFGVFDWKQTILGILFPFPIFFKIANNAEEYKVAEPTNWDVASQVDKRTPSDHVALFFALPILGHLIVMPLSMLGFKKKPGKKSMIKEWGDAILFAVIAASAIRTYVFEPYKIPTGSMEKTLLIGDHLFVDKLTYGPRLPMTPFSYPVVHNSFAPLINMRSYLEIQKIPYTRLPGFRDVNRNDVVVFNFPAGDTALNDPRMPNGLIGHNYHEILRDEAFYICRYSGGTLETFEENKSYYMNQAREQFREQGKVYSHMVRPQDNSKGYTEINGVLSRPVDKRENYIKRCVAVPGDLLEIKNKQLLINNKPAFTGKHMQWSYRIDSLYTLDAQTQNSIMKNSAVLERDFLRTGMFGDGPIGVHLNNESATALYQMYGDRLVLDLKERGFYHELASNPNNGQRYFPVFPNDPQYDWTEDNFGPLRMPKAGDVIELNSETLPIYERIIRAYERHELEERSDGIYVDGKKTDKYTIEMNYYWMMGDNRNGSADSRFFGFVPEDHIVGHAAFVWLSVDQDKGMFGGGMRWNRMFDGIE